MGDLTKAFGSTTKTWQILQALQLPIFYKFQESFVFSFFFSKKPTYVKDL